MEKTVLPGDLIKVRITKARIYDVEASSVGEKE
jgi:hypothetical protein